MKLIWILFFLYCSYLKVSAEENVSSIESVRFQSSLKLIGTVGRKSFYIGGWGIQLSWSKAWEFCRLHDLHLASIDSSVEEYYLLKYLEPEGKRDWWISLSDVIAEGKFTWMSTGKELGYANWGTGQPDNAGRTEHCVHVNLAHYPKWNDRQCDFSYSFICESTQENTRHKSLA